MKAKDMVVHEDGYYLPVKCQRIISQGNTRKQKAGGQKYAYENYYHCLYMLASILGDRRLVNAYSNKFL